jgi:AcrR family transcriptional regulator
MWTSAGGRARLHPQGCKVTAVSTSRTEARQRNARGAGQALREEIVSAARAMLIEDGYESAVTLRGVARRVGIAAQSIYPHFAGPDEIVQAVTVETFAALGRFIADAKQGIEAPRDRLLAGCRAYIAFGAGNPELYGLLFQRNRLLRGQEHRPDPSGPDTRNPDAGPFAYLMESVRQCIDDGSSGATSVLSTAVQLWAALHGLVLLLGNDYQFPWPDLAQTEIELVSSIAKLREPGRRAHGTAGH